MKVEIPWFTGELLKDLDNDLLLMTGGLGSGKTHAEWMKHLDMCAYNSESPVSVFFEPTYPKIFDTAIPTFRKVAQGLGYLENVHFSIKTGQPYPRIYLHTSGQEIQLRSAEVPSSIVGFEASHASCDEVAAMRRESFENIQSRVRCPKARKWQTTAGGAPQGITWLAEVYDSDTLPGWEHVHARNAISNKLSARRLTLWSDENTFLGRNYLNTIQRIYGHNANLIKAYRYGIFCPLVNGSCYANYLPQIHDMEDRDPDAALTIELCFDFNANPLAWVSVQRRLLAYYPERIWGWVATHEANEGNNNLADSVIEFAEKHPPRIFRNTLINIYGDPTGHHDSHKVVGTDYENISKSLKRLGYNKVEICADVSAPGETASVDAFDRLFVDKLFFVMKRCSMLRKGLMATVWKKGEKKIEKKAGETHTHHPDAVKYWAWKETRDASRIEIVKSYGANI